MKNVKSYDATIIGIERMKNSRNGNPKYMLTFQHDGGVISAATKTDSMMAYRIGNASGLIGHPVYVKIGTHYGTNTIDAIGG